MKRGKANGDDEVAVEMVEAIIAWGSDVVVKIANNIFDTGQILTEFEVSTILTIRKKPETIECNNFKTVSTMSLLGKLVLIVFLNRVRN